MPVLVLIVRLLLAGVFVLSATTKLFDRLGTRQAVADFGVPEALVEGVAFALPVAELLVAVLLIPGLIAWVGGIGAAIILLAFCVAISVNLVRGNIVDCHCFGQVHSEPISTRVLVRNAVLIVAAAFVAIAGRPNRDPSAFQSLGLTSSFRWEAAGMGLLMLALLGTLTWLVLRMSADNKQLFIRMKLLEADIRSGGVTARAGDEEDAVEDEDPNVGKPASWLELPNLTGQKITLADLAARGKPILMVFVHPSCATCSVVLPMVARWQQEYSSRLTISIISGGKLRANVEKAEEYGLQEVLVQKRHEIEQAYSIPRVPSAVMVLPDGRIGSPVATGPDDIRALFDIVLDLVHEQMTGAPTPHVHDNPNGHSQVAWPDISIPAPTVRLPDATGRIVDLKEFRGQRVMLLFWGTNCYHCDQMHLDIKEWEADPPEGAPTLVMVAVGPEEEVRASAREYRSTMLVDPEFEVGPTFNISGAPLAALIDEDGTYVTRIAGAYDILGVLRNEIPWPSALTRS